MCSPVMRPLTPVVVTTIGIFATSPLAIVATRSPNSTQTCVAMLSERFWPKIMACDGARSIASTVGSGWTIFGIPQYFLEDTAASRNSFGTRLSVIGEISGPVEGGGPVPAGSNMGRLGVCFLYSAVMARASSMVCFKICSFPTSPIVRKSASASLAYLRPSSRSLRAKKPFASMYSVVAVPKVSPTESNNARASLPRCNPSMLSTSVDRMALARIRLAHASPPTLPESAQMVIISVALSIAAVGLPLERCISAMDLKAAASPALSSASLLFPCASMAAFIALASSSFALFALTIVRKAVASSNFDPALLDAANAACAELSPGSASPFASCSSAVAISALAAPVPSPASFKSELAFVKAFTASEYPPSLVSWMDATMYIDAAFFALSSTFPTICSAT
mmetsp:Transcript_43090/g.137021  ORF Transcript_43090/g.137021 Transcript_43090/m.137021 type:complete len:397 (+) Transcript_43090:691-1881(+)